MIASPTSDRLQAELLVSVLLNQRAFGLVPGAVGRTRMGEMVAITRPCAGLGNRDGRFRPSRVGIPPSSALSAPFRLQHRFGVVVGLARR